jgi:hypothetical protein
MDFKESITVPLEVQLVLFLSAAIRLNISSITKERYISDDERFYYREMKRERNIFIYQVE